MKRIGIIGPGAVGCLFAAGMHRAGFHVTLIDKYPDRASRITETGISVGGVSGNYLARVPCIDQDSPCEPFDLVLMCVKAYATEEAIRMHRRRISENAAVLTLQNGYGNVEAISRHAPEDRILAGITTHGVNTVGDGAIRHAGFGDTFIGELSGKLTDRLHQVKTVLDRSGFAATLSDSVESLIFSKLLINTGINALTGILKLRNGLLAEIDETSELMRLAVAEGLQVAQKKNVDLDPVQIMETVEQVARRTAQNRSSMLMDILRQQRTEIDFINGAVVKLGRELGVETPVNNVVFKLIRAMEKTYELRESL